MSSTTLTDDDRRLVAAYTDGPALPRFKLSHAGNLTLRHGGKLLTVFQRWGGWRWSIKRIGRHKDEPVQYSPESYSDEALAWNAVLKAVGVIRNVTGGG
jgi:hypothetical protein